jgi:hypothetical protein
MFSVQRWPFPHGRAAFSERAGKASARPGPSKFIEPLPHPRTAGSDSQPYREGCAQEIRVTGFHGARLRKRYRRYTRPPRFKHLRKREALANARQRLGLRVLLHRFSPSGSAPAKRPPLPGGTLTKRQRTGALHDAPALAWRAGAGTGLRTCLSAANRLVPTPPCGTKGRRAAS